MSWPSSGSTNSPFHNFPRCDSILGTSLSSPQNRISTQSVFIASSPPVVSQIITSLLFEYISRIIRTWRVRSLSLPWSMHSESTHMVNIVA